MFENFNGTELIILICLCVINVICIAFIVFLSLKNKNKSVLEKATEIKVTKVNEEETSSLDEIMEAMQQDIDSEKEDAVELFEQEQEDKAIISYQELVKVKKKTEKPETIEKTEKKEETKNKALPKLVTTEKNKFTNSEFVSPVFGKMENSSNLEIDSKEVFDAHELEKTLNIEPLSDEIKKNNEFLNALKEFRKNL